LPESERHHGGFDQQQGGGKYKQAGRKTEEPLRQSGGPHATGGGGFTSGRPPKLRPPIVRRTWEKDGKKTFTLVFREKRHGIEVNA